LEEQVQISPSEDPPSENGVAVSDSDSDVDCDGVEYALFPELQSLDAQALQIIQLLP